MLWSIHTYNYMDDYHLLYMVICGPTYSNDLPHYSFYLCQEMFWTHFIQFRNHYWPQRSWAKVMFLQASVILSTGGVCLSVWWDTIPPPRADYPPGAETTPPPRADPPWEQTPRDQTPPRSRHPPGPDSPREADASIRSMSGRYASYWNAYLYWMCEQTITRKCW